MFRYAKYNKSTGEIVSIISGPSSIVESNTDDEYGMIRVDENIDDSNSRLDPETLEIVSKTQKEIIDELMEYRITEKPLLDFSKDIDEQIEEFYYGRVDVEQWKKDNYQWLRQQQYPDIGDQLDILWKYFKAQDQSYLTNDIKDMLKSIDKIKKQYPKE